MYLARKIELAVDGLEVLERITSDKLLVEPNLVVGSRAGKQVCANFLRELVHLSVQSGKGGDR